MTLIGEKTGFWRYFAEWLWGFCALATAVFAAEPKVGCTISFTNNLYSYRSNAWFKQRPIAEQMAKDGIDLCVYNGWDKNDALRSLQQFNVLWLITEHEHECPYPAAQCAQALKAYLEAGGGVVFCFSAGRYPEAPVDAYWTDVMKTFGAEILHEEIFNPETTVHVDKVRDMFYTTDFAEHPITKGIPGLWLADRSGGTWGSVAVKYSPEWQIIVRGGKGAKSLPKNRRTNKVEMNTPGFYQQDAPIVAVRTVGKGRLVFIASHKDTCGYQFNTNRWPNYPERSEYNGKKSDMVGLVENALKWASEPSLDDKAFVTHYQPVEEVIPPYKPHDDFGLRELEKRSYPQKFAVKVFPQGAKGVVGVHSAHSDGQSTVAEYVAAAKAAGLNFLVFTDPLEFLTAEKLAALRADCVANSGEDFYCCPGVEYTDSSDLQWAVWHDKVEFPDPKPFVKDGRTYTNFDGKRILQRNNYGGHQNLYRGVLLNMKKVVENGNSLINLAYFNAITPKVYDEGKLLFDNNPEYLQVGHNLHRAATVSFTKVRRAENLAAAAQIAMTCGKDLPSVRRWANAQGGWGGHEEGAAANLQAVYGNGVAIAGFGFRRVSGTDLYRIGFTVKCPAGVAEVAIRDGDRRLLGRFLPGGETEFTQVFDYLHDRQAVLILTAKGKDGSEAYSNSRWVFYYHAGMMRCGDNSNLLSQNPNVMMFLNWDDALVWPYKHCGRNPYSHFDPSEAVLWEAIHRTPSRFPSASCWGERSRIYLQGIEYPSEKVGLPSSHTVSTLNAPNVVSIFDCDLGKYIMDPTRNERNATYSLCSPVRKISDGKYWRRQHRVYQFVDRHDGWWRAVYKRLSPYYRGGYTIVEGKIDFTEAVTLAQPIHLVRISATRPAGRPQVFSRGGKEFTAGSYYALHSHDAEWYGFFGLKGSSPLHILESTKERGKQAILCLGQAGQSFQPGDSLTYRFAVGTFVEAPRDGQYCEWFAGMLDGSRFNHNAKRGFVTDINGMVEIAADRQKAVVEFGPTWFIQNYPVRIKGLVDNGSAVMTNGREIVRPLAFGGADAYQEVPLEKRQDWTFMNLYVADNPALRFTVVPAMSGHPRETVQIQNMTEQPITSQVRDVRKDTTFTVTVPAGEMIVK